MDSEKTSGESRAGAAGLTSANGPPPDGSAAPGAAPSEARLGPADPSQQEPDSPDPPDDAATHQVEAGTDASVPAAENRVPGETRPFRRRSANTHDWVIRTPENDHLTAATRLSTMWPLLRMYAGRAIQLRYRQSALGFAWTVVQPAFILAIYGVVFNIFLEVDSGGRPYIAVAWTGVAAWMFVQASLQQATVSLRDDSYMLDKLWFPREIIPFAPVVAGFVDLGVAGAILVVLVIATGVGLSIQAIGAAPVILILLLYVSAFSILAATITVFFRDMATIVALGMRLVFIGTPVMYTAATVPPDWRWVNAANPFAVVVLNLRTTVLAHQWPNWELMAVHAVIGTALLVFGVWYLRSVERRMADVA